MTILGTGHAMSGLQRSARNAQLSFISLCWTWSMSLIFSARYYFIGVLSVSIGATRGL